MLFRSLRVMWRSGLEQQKQGVRLRPEPGGSVLLIPPGWTCGAECWSPRSLWLPLKHSEPRYPLIRAPMGVVIFHSLVSSAPPAERSSLPHPPPLSPLPPLSPGPKLPPLPPPPLPPLLWLASRFAVPSPRAVRRPPASVVRPQSLRRRNSRQGAASTLSPVSFRDQTSV